MKRFRTLCAIPLLCLLGLVQGRAQEDGSVVLSVSNADNSREGRIITFPVMLKSNGDVGGITFDLKYNEVFLGEPVFEWSSLFGLSIHSLNTDTPGKMAVTFAFPGQTVPKGNQLVGNLSFRVRSMPFGMETLIEPELIEVSDALGDPIAGDHEANLGVARIDPRKVKGDNNGNGYLDVGDATLIQRLVAGMDPVRSWDVALNDLNESGGLDSGDVVKVLRVVVGVDPQPEGNRRLAKMGGGDDDSDEKVVLSIVKMNAGVVTVQVALDDMTTNVSGASFELQFSNEVLRLQKGSTSSAGGGEFSFTGAVTYNSTGGVVSKESQSIWNASQAGETPTKQIGTLAMAVTSPEPWEVKDGTVAEVTFEVQEGADINDAILSIKPVEVTPDGFDNRIISGLSLNLGTGKTTELVTGDDVGVEIVEIINVPFGFSFTSADGKSYAVEVTQDLKQWGELETYEGTGKPVKFTDPRLPIVPFKRNFYRVRLTD
jgi:hypothetical protein